MARKTRKGRRRAKKSRSRRSRRNPDDDDLDFDDLLGLDDDDSPTTKKVVSKKVVVSNAKKSNKKANAKKAKLKKTNAKKSNAKKSNAKKSNAKPEAVEESKEFHDAVKAVIASEDKSNPHSDGDIAKLLGITSKHKVRHARKKLGIPSAQQRAAAAIQSNAMKKVSNAVAKKKAKGNKKPKKSNAKKSNAKKSNSKSNAKKSNSKSNANGVSFGSIAAAKRFLSQKRGRGRPSAQARAKKIAAIAKVRDSKGGLEWLAEHGYAANGSRRAPKKKANGRTRSKSNRKSNSKANAKPARKAGRTRSKANAVDVPGFKTVAAAKRFLSEKRGRGRPSAQVMARKAKAIAKVRASKGGDEWLAGKGKKTSGKRARPAKSKQSNAGKAAPKRIKGMTKAEALKAVAAEAGRRGRKSSKFHKALDVLCGSRGKRKLKAYYARRYNRRSRRRK